MRRFAQAIVLAFACTTAHAGTITYLYHNTEFYDPGTAYMTVDEGAYFRGEILPGDVLGFSFAGMQPRDMAPLDIPISTDTGLPLAGTSLTASRELAPGIYYNLSAYIGPDGSGAWQGSSTGSRGLFGYGEWTVEKHLAPEPSSIVLGLMAAATVTGCIYLRRPVTGPSAP